MKRNGTRLDLSWYRQQLSRKQITRGQLLAIKDGILDHLSACPHDAYVGGLLLSRIKLRLSAAPQDQDPDPLAQFFIRAARQLLDDQTFDLIKREADRIAAEDKPTPLADLRTESVPQRRAATLGEVAAVRAMRFDPKRLFREFGREKVLTEWAAMRPEDKPETAAEFREALQRKQ